MSFTVYQITTDGFLEIPAELLQAAEQATGITHQHPAGYPRYSATNVLKINHWLWENGGLFSWVMRVREETP